MHSSSAFAITTVVLLSLCCQGSHAVTCYLCQTLGTNNGCGDPFSASDVTTTTGCTSCISGNGTYQGLTGYARGCMVDGLIPGSCNNNLTFLNLPIWGTITITNACVSNQCTKNLCNGVSSNNENRILYSLLLVLSAKLAFSKIAGV